VWSFGSNFKSYRLCIPQTGYSLIDANPNPRGVTLCVAAF